MSTSTQVEAQKTQAQAENNTTVQVTYQKHDVGLQTANVDAFPTIEIGHPVLEKPQRKNRNWKAFFQALPVGGVFTVENPKEAQSYYTRAYLNGIYLRRKRQPGGLMRMQRVK